MEIPKVIVLLCCAYHSLAEHSHTIPVENYETELQVLGQHVEYPETPVKIIKITKTVAVKIPVPYPVKVYEKVPYPVHISKPYPVPVPQIVHVPQPHQPQHKSLHEHEALDIPNLQHGGQHSAYETHEQTHEGDSFYAKQPSFNGNSAHIQGFGSSNDGYKDENPVGFYGYSGNNEDNGSYETKQYETIKHYPQKQHTNSLKNLKS